MNLSEIREGELKEVFDALEEAFAATGVEFYVIGALARDIWYARGNKTFRKTKDVDFAALVSTQDAYEAVKDYLKTHKNYEPNKGNSFVMRSPGGVQVDILPFGEIEIDEGVTITGNGLNSIKVNGFREVYQTGTEEVSMSTGHHFQVAGLPSIVLLKLIAFDDRPEIRSKDARDIASIIEHFFELKADFIYDNHLDLFSDQPEEQTLQEIAAIVIGREIRKICDANQELLTRLKSILQSHIDQGNNSRFIENMVAETNGTAEKAVLYLKNMLAALG